MSPEDQSLDALIVGAGFSGVQTLYKLRKEGFRVKIFEAGTGMGGTWHWNCYPGARVDSDHQIYQVAQGDLWKGFEWTERFPDYKEIRRYFDHVDAKIGLVQDIQFSARVQSGVFSRARAQWHVTTEDGTSVWASHLILCTGFASRRYTPPFKGLDSFKGVWHHSGAWPQNGGVELKGKRVAVVGTGASGVQIIQEIGPIVGHLTVYQRTPNIALPMQQYGAGAEDQWQDPNQTQEEIFSNTRKGFAGFNNMEFAKEKSLDLSPTQRRAHYEHLYKAGGFSLWLATYPDIFTSQVANDEEYAFWAEKTRARIVDPLKRELLAPLVPPHAFGTKRPCLEQAYYEVFNQDNVDLVNVRDSPIIEITPTGIRTEKEGVIDVDVLVLATGFDSVTGGILDIQLENGRGERIQDKWRTGTWTYMGLTTAGFENMYFLYGPHAPTAFSNGPTTGGIQGDWIAELLVRMRRDGRRIVEAEPDAEKAWTEHVREVWANTLFPGTESWYQGANIPGKPREALNYFGGIPEYIKRLERIARNGYEGFVLT